MSCVFVLMGCEEEEEEEEEDDDDDDATCFCVILAR